MEPKHANQQLSKKRNEDKKSVVFFFNSKAVKQRHWSVEWFPPVERGLLVLRVLLHALLVLLLRVLVLTVLEVLLVVPKDLAGEVEDGPWHHLGAGAGVGAGRGAGAAPSP